MILLKDESVKIMNAFDLTNRSAVMNLLTHRYSIPEYDAEDILQDAWVLLLDKLTVGEMHDVPEKLSAYLMKVCSYKAHEYLRKRQNEVRNPSFDDDAFTPEELTSFEMEAQSWDEFLEECTRTEHKKLDMMEQELEKLTPKETALLMGYYETDGSRTSMRELAQRLGYSSERVAITLKSRIMKKLRTGIQQQERAHGDGLSPVAFFIHTLSSQSFDGQSHGSLWVRVLRQHQVAFPYLRTFSKRFYGGETPRELFARGFTAGKMLANFSQAFLRRGNCSRTFRKQFYGGENARELFASSFTAGKTLTNFSQTVLRWGKRSRTFRKLFYGGENARELFASSFTAGNTLPPAQGQR